MNATTTPVSTGGAAAPARNPAPSRRVTDAPTRMFHWLFALAFAGAYITADGERWRALHVTLGYTLAGLLVFRLLYALFGPRPVRLPVLVAKTRAAFGWARDALQARAPLPALARQALPVGMGLSIVMLLLLTAPLTLSGYATFHEWSGEWLEEVHEFFGNAMLALALGHIALLAALSAQRKRNLALPMLTGRTPGAGPDLVPANRRWLAAALLVAVVAYGAWEWQASPQGLLPTAGGAGHHQRTHGDDD